MDGQHRHPRKQYSRGARRAAYCLGSLLAAVGAFLGVAPGVAAAGTSSQVAQAKTHLLVRSDLPAGWSVEKGNGGSGGGSGGGPGGGFGGLPGGKELASCIGVPLSVLNDASPSADGPYYQSKDQSLEVQDSVSVFPSAAYARTQLAAMSSAKTPSCVAQYLNGPGKSLFGAKSDKGETVGTVTAEPLTAKAFGPAVVGFVMNVPVTYKGLSLDTQVISVNAIKGRLGQSITYSSYGEDFPSTLATHLDAIALGRL